MTRSGGAAQSQGEWQLCGSQLYECRRILDALASRVGTADSRRSGVRRRRNPRTEARFEDGECAGVQRVLVPERRAGFEATVRKRRPELGSISLSRGTIVQ